MRRTDKKAYFIIALGADIRLLKRGSQCCVWKPWGHLLCLAFLHSNEEEDKCDCVFLIEPLFTQRRSDELTWSHTVKSYHRADVKQEINT